MNVYLISEPRLDFTEVSRFIEDEMLPPGCAYHVEPASDAEILAELAGRICYMSFGKGRKSTGEFLANITAQKHFSVMEHANWTFIITGVSRSLTHELVRHRHLSYSQLSQRYVDESEVTFVQPAGIPDSGEAYEEWKCQCEVALMSYKVLVEELEKSPTLENLSSTDRRKWVRQAARAVLPNCTETKIVVTGNARAWREFILKRDSPHADPEIRALAHEIDRILVLKSHGLFMNMEEQ